VFDISPIQILLVLVIALLVFGPKRLPEMGRSIGRGIREFKGAMLDETPGQTPARPVEPTEATRTAPVDADEDVLQGVVVRGDTPPPGPRDAS
jgi:sec-independent protein translocase protein TatA